MKALANEARLLYRNTPNTPYSPSARKVYQKEVDSLNASNIIAKKNAPRERQAQLIANITVRNKKKDNPDMDNDDLKKIKNQALAAARARVGANKKRVSISEKEWEAIQAGAISNSKLSEILRNANLDEVKRLATPRSSRTISDAKLSKMKAMKASGYSTQETADAIGVSSSTVSRALAASCA